jgi:methylated-DNA-protein-cysteine methyltransferase-like protein
LSTTSDRELDRLAVYAVIKSIPLGKVASYGQVANLAGLGNGARWVGRLLAQLPKDSQLPWFRVINSHGKISLSGDAKQRQIDQLNADGIVVTNGRVNLSLFGWQP